MNTQRPSHPAPPPMLAAAALCLIALAGCSPPAATLQLIAVARQGIKGAQDAQVAQHEQLTKFRDGQSAALDAAFDADVRLAASGALKDASGKPLALTEEWVISARKGYTAARDLIQQQAQADQAAHAARLDNLKASDEALDMAGQLIIQQQGLALRAQQELADFQRRLSHGQ